jgi:hypothetical protein
MNITEQVKIRGENPVILITRCNNYYYIHFATYIYIYIYIYIHTHTHTHTHFFSAVVRLFIQDATSLLERHIKTRDSVCKQKLSRRYDHVISNVCAFPPAPTTHSGSPPTWLIGTEG